MDKLFKQRLWIKLKVSSTPVALPCKNKSIICGIGSFELDRVLWTMKGKRKGAAVKVWRSE